jgi:DNA-binding XRE family transcriptional regulator
MSKADRQNKALEQLTAEQRAAVERVRAKHRSPAYRAEAQRVRAAVMEEFPPTMPDRDTRAALDVLAQERERLGLSLTDVSERSGLDRTTISKLENGHIPNPTLRTLNLYARALGKRLKVVLEG